MNSIIVPAGDYDSKFYSSLPQDIEDYQAYYNDVWNNFKRAKEIFPLLRLVILPTKKCKTAFIQGLLLSKQFITKCRLEPEQYEEYGLPIYADIPSNFTERGITVYDCCNRIVWEKIPLEYRHRRQAEGTYKYCICTHHNDFITPQNCFLGVLQSAFNLFVEYQRYNETGKFELNCLPHDYE